MSCQPPPWTCDKNSLWNCQEWLIKKQNKTSAQMRTSSIRCCLAHTLSFDSLLRERIHWWGCIAWRSSCNPLHQWESRQLVFPIEISENKKKKHIFGFLPNRQVILWHVFLIMKKEYHLHSSGEKRQKKKVTVKNRQAVWAWKMFSKQKNSPIAMAKSLEHCA